MPASLDTLRDRLLMLVPAHYRETPAKVGSMGSAGLKHNADGTVAWDKIWGSFCDLAMAGGPPHKGTLLQPATASEIAVSLGAYEQAVREVCRGITLVTALDAEPEVPGWVRISCGSNAMAGWLLRAITTENIAVRAEGSILYLPVGPDYRLDKQIKNVITVIAKTTHYWRDHMPASQQWAISDLFAAMEAESPLLQPAHPTDEGHYRSVSELISRETSLTPLPARYPGWIGIGFSTSQAARETMRLSIAMNVLARCEETTLFLPLNPATDPDGSRLVDVLLRFA